jgi:hypothetical protein
MNKFHRRAFVLAVGSVIRRNAKATGLAYLIALALVSLAGAGMANPVPDPPNCRVMPCDILGPGGIGGVLVCPSGPAPIPGTQVTVTVLSSSGNPMQGIYVQVTFPPGSIRLCSSDPETWRGITDSQGIWRKDFSGGGCARGDNACVITANGIEIRAYRYVRSPDWDGASGNLMLQANDFANFLMAYHSGGEPLGCSDFDGSGATDLGDFIVMAQAFSPGHSCP